ncbi:hypothetical protein N7T98_25905, partial [Pseudomonas syringae pv. tomato]|uniref:hypothetical protein n=1 Tax=Pseudomonas syringae group genomosp. 3 TaxID=251701 RepID=UPI0022A7A904
MILTEQTIENMPRLLKSFKKYIEKYECSYSVEYGISSLMFYHKGSLMPYVYVAEVVGSNYPIIYVNKNADNWSRSGRIIRDNISNNFKAFIEAIRECEESVPGRTYCRSTSKSR